MSENKNIMIIDEIEYQTINQSRTIYLPGNFVCSELIHKILIDDNYYNYTLKYFKDEVDVFKISYMKNNNIMGNITYTKSEILLAIEIYLKENNIKDKIMIERYQLLKKEISLDTFKEKYNEKSFDISIDNKKYHIQIKDIISFLSKTNYEFRSICDDDNIKEIFGIPKEYFIYAVQEFIKKDNIVNNYLFTNNMNKNIQDILKNYVDVEALNHFLETKESLYEKVHLNKELEDAIKKDMPEELSQLEKALYIYVKMCNLLSYDEEYHALNQEGEVTLKHQDINHIADINLKNNQVTCFEFNIIYAHLLKKLGINFESTYRDFKGEDGYGKTHVELRYRVGKYLVFADSSESIFEGDMANAKVNHQVFGIRCLNKNSKTQEEFDEALEKVKRIIYKNITKENFTSLVQEYQKKTSNLKKVSLEDKVQILFSKMQQYNYQGVDMMAYLLHLKRVIFNYDELNFNIRFNIICNHLTLDKNQLGRLSLIISMNNDDLSNHEKTRYFILSPQEEMYEISYEELKSKFDEGVFEYLERDDNFIYGINRKGEK